MVDLVTVGDASLRLSPVGSERLETATDVRMRTAGSECGVAVAASRLGCDAVWLSKLPDTPLGHRVVAEIHEHGTSTEVTWSDEGRQGLLFHETAAEPRGSMTIADRTGTAAATMTPGELRMDLVKDATAVFVAGSTLALSGTGSETAQAVLRASDGLTTFDLDYQPSMWPDTETARSTITEIFDVVDILFANEDQIEAVFQKNGQAREIAHTMAAEHDFDLVVVTRSEHGAIAYHDGVIHSQDSIETEATDPSGQHEAFTGGFLERLVAGETAEVALKHGVATAALSRTIPGPLTAVTEREVADLVAEME